MGKDNKNYFLLLGGAENLEWFEDSTHEKFENLDFFWTVTKATKLGDIAFIYLTAPVSRVVGKVEIIGDPFQQYQDTMFENPKMRNKWCAQIKFLANYDLSQLSMRSLRNIFGKDWNWLSYPRGNTKIPKDILPAFLELVGEKDDKQRN